MSWGCSGDRRRNSGAMLPSRALCSEVLTSLLCLTSPSSSQQEYKRRSRDIETETEEDLLLFPSLDASSGSLSSSVSLSDKSVSTDNNVEEFFGDAPFAGQFVGRLACSMSGKIRALPYTATARCNFDATGS